MAQRTNIVHILIFLKRSFIQKKINAIVREYNNYRDDAEEYQLSSAMNDNLYVEKKLCRRVSMKPLKKDLRIRIYEWNFFISVISFQ